MWRYWQDILLDHLFPRLCSGCGLPLQKGEKSLCLFCVSVLPLTDFKCATDNPMEKLFQGRLPIVSANAYMQFRKGGLAQTLMHELKYNGDQALGKALGKLFGAALMHQKHWQKPEVLTCVPLHPSKERKRGFNQSVLIGQGMAESLEIPFRPDLLKRPGITDTQTLKKRYERWENMQSGFVQGEAHTFNHIGLVDDVVTTGATMEACGLVLQANSPAKVSVFALCISIR